MNAAPPPNPGVFAFLSNNQFLTLDDLHRDMSKPKSIVKPRSKKYSREGTPVLTPVTEDKSGEVKPEKEADAWSGWVWSEETGFWYRARKDDTDLWHYEYAAPTTGAAPVKEETPQYLKTSIIYLEDESIIRYPEEHQYTYEGQGSGEDTYGFLPAPNEVTTRNSSAGEEVFTQKLEKNEAMQIMGHDEEIGQAGIIEKKKGEEPNVREIGLERVAEWRRLVNDALEKMDEFEKKQLGKESRSKKEKHPEKKEKKHKVHKWSSW